MLGLLMVLPLLPFYAERLEGTGLFGELISHIGSTGLVVGLLVSSFAVAQLLSAPFWGRVSDRYGRRPALLIGLGASFLAYIIFAYADTLSMLFLSRLVQGAGGGTVGVIQAYVADATEPENRAKSLGWLSAATNAGVAIGPVIGSWSRTISAEAPGLIAASIVSVNMVFVWFFLRESYDVAAARADGHKNIRSRDAVWNVITHSREPAPRLIWIYAIAMGAFQGMTSILALFLAVRFGVTAATIGYFFMYIGAIGFLMRAAILGWAVDWLGEVRLSRIGSVLLAAGLALLPLTQGYLGLAIAVALVPIGTAFTFPCITSLLSRVIGKHERGLYMGVQQSFGGAARVIGPLWAGWAYDHLGIGVPFWTGAIMVFATIFIGIGMESYTRSDHERRTAAV